MTCSLLEGNSCTNYWRKYCFKKIRRLVLPLLFTGILYFILQHIILNEEHTIISYFTALNECLIGITRGVTVTLNAWYVYLLIWFCVLFFLVFRTFTEGESNILFRVVVLTVLIIFTILVMFFLNWGGWWYKSCFAFPLGILWRFYRDVFQIYITKNKRVIIGIETLLYILPWVCEDIINNTFINDIGKVFYPISSCAIVILFLVFISQYEVQSKVFYLIGKYSFEMYLIHGLIYTILRCNEKLINMGVVFALLTLMLTFVSAIAIQKLFIFQEGSKKQKYELTINDWE